MICHNKRGPLYSQVKDEVVVGFFLYTVMESNCNKNTKTY